MAVSYTDIQDLPSGEFASISQSVIEKFIARAQRIIDESVWGELYDDAVELMTAHILLSQIDGGRGPAGPVLSARAGPMATSYAEPNSPSLTADSTLQSTTYGIQYLELRRSLGIMGLVTTG